MTNASVIKPGILVSLSTRLRGGVSYVREGMDADGVAVAEGAEVTKWVTTRIIDDADDYEAARKVRSAAGAAIRKVCATTSFGLLCAAENEGALDEAIDQARALCDLHNRGASTTAVSIYVLKGRVAETDEEAAAAIASEINELLDAMKRGIREVDPVAIRDAARRAREVSAVLSDDQQARVGKAVDAARSAAKAIVKRVAKSGEDAALVVQEITLAPIDAARFVALDLADATDHVQLPAVDAARFAAIGGE